MHCKVGVRAAKISLVCSTGTAIANVKATETQCRTETNVSGYSEDGGKRDGSWREDRLHTGTDPDDTAYR